MNETLGKIWTEAGVLARKARAQAKPVAKALVGNTRASWKYGLGGAVASGIYGNLSSDRNSTGREQALRTIGYAAGGAALGMGVGTAVKSGPGTWRAGKSAAGELRSSFSNLRKPRVTPLSEAFGSNSYQGSPVAGLMDWSSVPTYSRGALPKGEKYLSLKGARAGKFHPMSNDDVVGGLLEGAESINRPAPRLSNTWLPQQRTPYDSWRSAAFIKRA